jgi:ammonia channel protein AmtB
VSAALTHPPLYRSFVLGGLDFAGGSPVHISSGSAALAISVYLGKRTGWGTARCVFLILLDCYRLRDGFCCVEFGEEG